MASEEITLAGHLIAANSEADARQLLQTLVRAYPDFEIPARWLEFLEAERLDRIALLEQPSDRTDALGRHTRRAGIWLETMRPVWVQIARPDEIASHEETLDLHWRTRRPWGGLRIGVRHCEDRRTLFRRRECRRISRSSAHRKSGTRTRRRHCASVTRPWALLNALAAVGVQLPDVELARFTLERSGALLLTDLAGAKRVDPDVRGEINFELARSCCSRRVEPSAPLHRPSCSEIGGVEARRVVPNWREGSLAAGGDAMKQRCNRLHK